MQSIIHLTYTDCLLCVMTSHISGYLGEQVEKTPVSHGANVLVCVLVGETDNKQTDERL